MQHYLQLGWHVYLHVGRRSLVLPWFNVDKSRRTASTICKEPLTPDCYASSLCGYRKNIYEVNSVYIVVQALYVMNSARNTSYIVRTKYVIVFHKHWYTYRWVWIFIHDPRCQMHIFENIISNWSYTTPEVNNIAGIKIIIVAQLMKFSLLS